MRLATIDHGNRAAHIAHIIEPAAIGNDNHAAIGTTETCGRLEFRGCDGQRA